VLLLTAGFKRQGRVVVLAEPVETSGRCLRNQSFWLIAWRLMVVGPDGFRKRGSARIWYKVERE